MADIVAIVDLGPRAPGTDGHRRGLEFLSTRLDTLADQLTRHQVSAAIASGDTVVGTNLIASFNLTPKRNIRVMLGAHWDTRAQADQDSDSTKRSQPVPGANDGASGTAVLLEMARLLHHMPLDIGVDLLFFDLEDIGADSTTPFAVGSEAFAEDHPHYRPTYGIVVDMVCDGSLELRKERNSMNLAPGIIEKVWQAARTENASAFLDEMGGSVTDDHIPFLKRRVPVINLIHYPFPEYWHTTDDTPDKCDAESLDQVGRVLARVVYSE